MSIEITVPFYEIIIDIMKCKNEFQDSRGTQTFIDKMGLVYDEFTFSVIPAVDIYRFTNIDDAEKFKKELDKLNIY